MGGYLPVIIDQCPYEFEHRQQRQQLAGGRRNQQCAQPEEQPLLLPSPRSPIPSIRSQIGQHLFRGKDREDGDRAGAQARRGERLLELRRHGRRQHIMYKLIDDRKHLKDYGIKDSDQLHFIRHLSFDQSASKRRQKHHEALVEHHKATVEHHKAMVERNVMLLAGPEGLEECEKENKNAKDNENSSRGLLAESEDLEELKDENTNAKSDDNDSRRVLAGLDSLEELEEENKNAKNDDNFSSSESTDVQNDDEEESMLGHSQLKKANLWRNLRYSRIGSLRKSRSEKSDKIRHWRSKSYF